MRSSADFRETVRHGVRVGRRTVVVHAFRSAASSDSSPDVLIGVVVSKSVGNAVTRNAVKRRLRHLAMDCLPDTPNGCRVVLRALPPAALSPDHLRQDVPEAWRASIQRLRRRGGFA